MRGPRFLATKILSTNWMIGPQLTTEAGENPMVVNGTTMKSNQLASTKHRESSGEVSKILTVGSWDSLLSLYHSLPCVYQGDQQHRNKISENNPGKIFKATGALPVGRAEIADSPRAQAATKTEYAGINWSGRFWFLRGQIVRWGGGEAKRTEEEFHMGPAGGICVEMDHQLEERKPGQKFKGYVVSPETGRCFRRPGQTGGLLGRISWRGVARGARCLQLFVRLVNVGTALCPRAAPSMYCNPELVTYVDELKSATTGMGAAEVYRLKIEPGTDVDLGCEGEGWTQEPKLADGTKVSTMMYEMHGRTFKNLLQTHASIVGRETQPKKSIHS